MGRRKGATGAQDGRRQVVRQMVRILDRAYGGAAWDRERTPPDALDCLMRTVLSQNTNDGNRDRAYRRLRETFPSWEAVMTAGTEAVKDAIRVAGLANQKGPCMQGFLRWLQAERGDLDLGFICGLPLEEAVRLLTRHKGVGIKTAYVVLAFACNKDVCAVDTHIHRILRRVGVVDAGCGREKAHLALAPLIPKGKARSFHVDLLDLGKEICKARKPCCDVCPISHLCAYYRTDCRAGG